MCVKRRTRTGRADTGDAENDFFMNLIVLELDGEMVEIVTGEKCFSINNLKAKFTSRLPSSVSFIWPKDLKNSLELPKRCFSFA
jgi:hypothetical protein